MNKGEYMNKVYIIDATLILAKIDNCVDIISREIIQDTDMDFRTKQLIYKDIVSLLICKLIRETNDAPVYSLFPSDLSDSAFYGRSIHSFMNELHLAVYSLYGNMFRFYNNVEVNVDTVLSGHNITVFTYENRLD